MRPLVRSATVLVAAAGCSVLGGSVLAVPAWADTTVSAQLHGINHSGVRGNATLTAHDDGSLTVVIRGRGYVPGQPHAQHIHGSFGGKHFMCPTMADDTNGDGVLTNEEGSGEYGTIFLALTTRGDTKPTSGLSLDRMPVADASGRLDYRRTIPAAQVPDALLQHLSDVHIVQHGIDANGNGKYDLAGLGPSTFAANLGLKGVPEEATDPAACGVLTGSGAAVAPHGGVETGGGSQDVGSVNGALAALGGALLACALLLLAQRPRRDG
jgi:hypothetical protein